jgi:hypothetical protein
MVARVNTSMHETESLLFITLLQLIVIVGVARCMHNVFRCIGQPGVIGEIFAGLLLGPSFFGHFFPQFSSVLFAAHASTPIGIISQIGLIFLMFQIGMDFQFGHLTVQRNRRAVIGISIVSVGVPLGLGAAARALVCLAAPRRLSAVCLPDPQRRTQSESHGDCGLSDIRSRHLYLSPGNFRPSAASPAEFCFRNSSTPGAGRSRASC